MMNSSDKDQKYVNLLLYVVSFWGSRGTVCGIQGVPHHTGDMYKDKQ